jgi:hypothetical protein
VTTTAPVIDLRTREVVHEGTSLPDSPPENTAEVRAPAREGTPDASPREVALRDTWTVWLAARQAYVKGLADKSGTLLHAQPPTFKQAIVRHHECAGHYRKKPVRVARVGYGYVHTALIKAPVRLSIHVLLAVAVWVALALGGYL